MKIATIIGARPQFIKMAPVSRELRKCCEEVIIHTGQHYDYEMNDIFFKELNIPEPDYNLGVGSGTHGYQTGEMLKGIEKILLYEKPDVVLVYGDTNSTLAGALASVKLHIPVAHVEAGVRSYDRKMPEEINRVLTDHASNILFAPTENAVKNLEKEGIKKGVYLVGDAMVDSLLYNIKIAQKKSGILEKFNLRKKGYVLVTVHRPENTDNKENLKSIVDALVESEEKIIFPAHLRTLKALKQHNLYSYLENAENVILTKPIGYLDMLVLEKNAKKILTDSGGVQKEAYILKVPCITMRSTTEWIETIEDGWNILVGSDKNKIVDAIKNFNPKGNTHLKQFGDGKASEKIREDLINGYLK